MKKCFLLLTTLVMIMSLGVGQSVSAAVSSSSNLEKSEVDYYSELINESSVYQNNTLGKEILNIQAQSFSENDEEIVVVNGEINGDETNAVQFIVQNDEVVGMTHIESTGMEAKDDFSFKTYGNEGDLIVEHEGSVGDLFDGNVTIELNQSSEQEFGIQSTTPGPGGGSGDDGPSDSQIFWACQFSSLFVCLGAAGVNPLLGAACQLAFSGAAC